MDILIIKSHLLLIIKKITIDYSFRNKYNASHYFINTRINFKTFKFKLSDLLLQKISNGN